MEFQGLLDILRQSDPPKEVAVEVLRRSREPVLALRLFQAASEIRDRELGRTLWWSAGISAMMPCKIEPRCTYCTFFTVKSFPMEELVASVKAVEAMGIRHLHLSGGSCLDGYDNEMAEMINAIRDASDMNVEVNLGPSFSRQGVQRFKQMGVRSVTSSLEVFNPEVFARVKPGDSLEARKRLIEVCQDEGMSVRSMILVGLGESEADRIDHLYWLKQFPRLRHLRFSRFMPYPGTEAVGQPRCSPWEVSRLVAVARLLMPTVDLGLAAGNSHEDIPLWYAAGGGNQLLGATISLRQGRAKPQTGEEVLPVTERIELVSRMGLIRQFVQGLGRDIGSDLPFDDRH
jgi:biotin synthase